MAQKVTEQFDEPENNVSLSLDPAQRQQLKSRPDLKGPCRYVSSHPLSCTLSVCADNWMKNPEIKKRTFFFAFDTCLSLLHPSTLPASIPPKIWIKRGWKSRVYVTKPPQIYVHAILKLERVSPSTCCTGDMRRLRNLLKISVAFNGNQTIETHKHTLLLVRCW